MVLLGRRLVLVFWAEVGSQIEAGRWIDLSDLGSRSLEVNAMQMVQLLHSLYM